MKKCPVCDKTFEDSMRFCQVDGTALVADAPPANPFGTAAPSPENTPVAPPFSPSPVMPEPPIPEPISPPVAEPEEVLDLPSDPLKTMVVSDAELRQALGDTNIEDAPAMEIPPIEPMPVPEPPKFTAPEPPPPSFGDMAPPASPFGGTDPAPAASESAGSSTPSPFDAPSAPIEPLEPLAPPPIVPEPVPEPTPLSEAPPSPFQMDSPATSEPPPFSQPEPPAPIVVSAPPEQSAPAEQWTPPPAPDASWQNQQIGSDTPFQPPPSGVAGQSQGLAIGSLVCGVLSCLCCFSIVMGPVGIVLGLKARSKAASDPANYGGAGLALGGLIAGIFGTLVGVGQVIYIILNFAVLMASLAAGGR